MNWTEKSLDELGFFSRGKSRHRPRDAAHLYGGPYPFIQTGDVKHAGLYLSDYKQTYSDAGLAQSKLWPRSLSDLVDRSERKPFLGQFFDCLRRIARLFNENNRKNEQKGLFRSRFILSPTGS